MVKHDGFSKRNNCPLHFDVDTLQIKLFSMDLLLILLIPKWFLFPTDQLYQHTEHLKVDRCFMLSPIDLDFYRSQFHGRNSHFYIVKQNRKIMTSLSSKIVFKLSCSIGLFKLVSLVISMGTSLVLSLMPCFVRLNECSKNWRKIECLTFFSFDGWEQKLSFSFTSLPVILI